MKEVMTEVQKQVQQTIDGMVESGVERGMQVAVFHRGKQVVDAVAGIADPAMGRQVTSETPFYNFSVCKAATSTVVHMLAEHGMFEYDSPVVDLWPEFGAHGKRRVTLRHVLSHTAGVPGIPLDTTLEDLCNWDKMCAAIAASELWWEPGTRVGYHAYTFGYILGEIVRRATGKPISRVLMEEVSGPLGAGKELYFGMPRSEQHRLAVLEDAPVDPQAMAAMASMPPDLPMFKAAPMSAMPNAHFGNREDLLAADIPAGGKSSARAIARLYAALLGAIDGVRLISPERLRDVTTVASTGVDEIFGMPTKWGLGYSIGRPGAMDSTSVFGVGGVGGSFAFGDTSTGIAFAMNKNRLTQDFNAAAQLSQLVTDALG
jgi:CubicO group peptidase (beta-lactamase class C family)